MIEYETTIATPDGVLDAFVARPAAAAPAVILYMDVWGVRRELCDIARRIAGAGYYCILPNLYYRQGKVRFEFRDERGRTISMAKLPPETAEEVRQQMRRLSDAMVIDDTREILRFIERDGALPGAVGAVGFCMGGRHAMCAAAHFPQMQATASLHGTLLVQDTPLSPHKFADKFEGEIYAGFAEHDNLAPPATISALAEILGGRPNVAYAFAVHPGTTHGYSLPDRDIYDHAATERDWSSIFAMFARRLARAASSADARGTP
jgi:carboxymethylenebutenolidase